MGDNHQTQTHVHNDTSRTPRRRGAATLPLATRSDACVPPFAAPSAPPPPPPHPPRRHNPSRRQSIPASTAAPPPPPSRPAANTYVLNVVNPPQKPTVRAGPRAGGPAAKRELAEKPPSNPQPATLMATTAHGERRAERAWRAAPPAAAPTATAAKWGGSRGSRPRSRGGGMAHRGRAAAGAPRAGRQCAGGRARGRGGRDAGRCGDDTKIGKHATL